MKTWVNILLWRVTQPPGTAKRTKTDHVFRWFWWSVQIQQSSIWDVTLPLAWSRSGWSRQQRENQNWIIHYINRYTDIFKAIYESKSFSLSWQMTMCSGVCPQQAEAGVLVNKWRKSQEEMYNEFFCLYLSLQWLSLPLSPSCPFTSAASLAKPSNLEISNSLSSAFFSNFEMAGLSD